METNPGYDPQEFPQHLALVVNGVDRTVNVPPRRLLADVLRHDIGLTGTHLGCEHGVCGACTVLVDGAPMRSCLLFAVSVDGAEITTVEGCRAPDGTLGAVQQAFVDCHGLQCGFCTPGFVTTITAYLREHPDPTEAEARDAIGGNLCRCTGYQNIVASVLRAAELLRATPVSGESGDRTAAAPDTTVGGPPTATPAADPARPATPVSGETGDGTAVAPDTSDPGGGAAP